MPVTARSVLLTTNAISPQSVTGRVLCVEDDDVSYELVLAFFSVLLPLVNLRRASTVAEAVSTTRKFAPGVVLLDLRLPDDSGLEFIREFSREIGADAFDVVVVTADMLGPDVAKARALGARSVIFKPIDLGQLAAAVTNNLARRAAAA